MTSDDLQKSSQQLENIPSTSQESAAASEAHPTTGKEANDLTKRWGGRTILTLQSAYDKLVAGRVNQLQTQVTTQDRELSELSHDIAELTAQVIQMNRLLHSLEERLSRLETDKTPDET